MARLKIEKRGNIKSGHIDYDIRWNDNGCAIVSWRAKVKIKMGFFSKTFESNSEETVPGSTVKAASYREVGQRQEYLDKFAASVVNTDGSTSVLCLVSKKYSCNGEMVVGITEDLVHVKNLEIRGKAYGMSLTIKAHEI